MNYNDAYRQLRHLVVDETCFTAEGAVTRRALRRFEFRPLTWQGGWQGLMVVLQWRNDSWNISIHEPQLFYPYHQDSDYENRWQAADELINKITSEQARNTTAS